MVDELLRKFAQENFGHGYYTAVPGEIEKVQPLVLAIKKYPPIWKRPFKTSQIIVLAGLEKYLKSKEEALGFRDYLKSKIKEETFQSKQKIDKGSRTKELDASFVGHLEGTIRLNDDQGVLELGNLSQKYIDDPDLREILAKTALDAKIKHSFTDGDKLLLITEIQAELKLPEPSATPNHSAKRHYRVTSYFGEMPSRDFKAPILFRCCNVKYIKEENRLEIPKGEFVGRSVL
ncbi:uncharacterized protein [Pocillopora verrucosa]|uniref:uncharacterized protein isoform X2 n=1 Tax=Pocillopora verrucosa TaxID=203993 RepID=UPI002797B609|nr:uncharacterized protein LOC131771645 isoform X2 [Pocillopora verrucosa]